MRAVLFLLFSVLFFVITDFSQASNPMFAVSVDGKQGFIDRSGKIVIAPRFIQCGYKSRFVDGLAVICTKESNKAGFIDTTGKFVIEQKFSDARNFSEGLAAVYFGDYGMHRGYDEAGFIDKTGKLVVQPVYDAVMDFSEGLAAVRKDKKSGFIDKTGKIVIPLRFDYAFSFSEGLALVFVEDKYGFIDKSGKMVIEPQFTYAGNFSENLAMVKIGGSSILPYPYSENIEWQTIGRIDTEYGYINKKGEIIHRFVAANATDFSEGLAAVQTIDGYGFINPKGKFLIRPQFADIFGRAPRFSDNLALTMLKNRKMGFINKMGKVVIKTDYAYASDFENGLAEICVQINDACGYINKTGKVIWTPSK